MSGLPSPGEISNIVSLIAPGLIITAIRARAITGSAPEIKDNLLSYAIVSMAYTAIVNPLFHVTGAMILPLWMVSTLQNVVWPVLIGIALAYAYQWQWSYRLAARFKLRLAYHLPAAWDYVFESLPADSFVLVTLHDGTQVAGKMGKDSFAASDKTERDLFIQEVWKLGDPWEPLNPPRGILLCGSSIKFVEIF